MENRISVRTNDVKIPFVPFQLVSLYQVIRVYSSPFATALARLAYTDGLLVKSAIKGQPISDSLKGMLRPVIQQIDDCCEKLSLNNTRLLIKRVKTDFDAEGYSQDRCQTDMSAIEESALNELSSVIFLVVPFTKKDYLDAEMPFGLAVFEAFPSASYDISEAAKCFALSRDTAAVFHVSRVAEIGLKILASKLSVPATVPSWDGILKKIDVELGKDYKDKLPDWKPHEDFYAEASLHLRTYKNSRNNTQHAEKKYTPEEAERIFIAVRSLMQHLATRLSEAAEVAC